MSIVDMTEPTRAPHPTIYYVVLTPEAELRFLCSQNARDNAIALWKERAKQLGKRTVVVHGRYRQLLQEDL